MIFSLKWFKTWLQTTMREAFHDILLNFKAALNLVAENCERG